MSVFDEGREPKDFEKDVAKAWEEANCFHAVAESSADSYTIVIPPPNVTAALHLGHALNNTLQDILIRAHRMRGRNTLWMPGTDHAGIATQTVVEKRLLATEGKRRTDFKREEFVERVQAWKDEYEARILGQLKAMGCSCDWQRTRFTMDQICARSVRAAFFKLFKDGLLYRGLRLVNWDPATRTVLADDELEHKELDTSFWYLRYPLETPVDFEGQSIEYVVVGTTRPETMLGDTGVAMNPKDPRASVLVGQNVVLPLVGRKIPIVADDHVVQPDPESKDEKARYSSGFLKVTPAHDPHDWDIGQRHGLEIINVMAPDASISAEHGFDDAAGTEAEQFLGKSRYEARKGIIAWFKEQGLLEEIRPYKHSVAHSYRSHVPTEPYLSKQWYVAVKKPIESMAEKFGADIIPDTDVPQNSLAGLALKPRLDGALKFVPERYSSNYDNWLTNLRDWPVSRQLWWGHRIPIWKKAGTHTPKGKDHEVAFVTIDEGDDEGLVTYACINHSCMHTEKILEADGWVQDEDVLDTWFSSALWPFSTLGWPSPTMELKTYYPGHVLCTAREIITLWVSRMVMMGQYCLGAIPFTDVFIHAMIQDGKGQKMSKTLGNGIDPLVVIDSHGSDAMRYVLCAMTTLTQDVRMPVSEMKLPDGRVVNSSAKFDLGRKLITKIWNAARFVSQQLENAPAWSEIDPIAHLADRWILSRLSDTTRKVNDSLANYKYSEMADAIYAFVWNEFCDWYLEIAKGRIQNGETAPKAVLAFVWDQFLRLFHPIAPFTTEVLWKQLNEDQGVRGPGDAKYVGLLAQAEFPSTGQDGRCLESEKQLTVIQDLVRQIRDARKTNNVGPGKPLKAVAEVPASDMDWFQSAQSILVSQARLEDMTVQSEAVTQSPDMVVVASGELKIFVRDLVDREAELKRLNKKAETLRKGIGGVEKKLGNEKFVSKAPEKVVESERQRLAQMQSELKALEDAIAALG